MLMYYIEKYDSKSHSYKPVAQLFESFNKAKEFACSELNKNHYSEDKYNIYELDYDVHKSQLIETVKSNCENRFVVCDECKKEIKFGEDIYAYDKTDHDSYNGCSNAQKMFCSAKCLSDYICKQVKKSKHKYTSEDPKYTDICWNTKTELDEYKTDNKLESKSNKQVSENNDDNTLYRVNLIIKDEHDGLYSYKYEKCISREYTNYESALALYNLEFSKNKYVERHIYKYDKEAKKFVEFSV